MRQLYIEGKGKYYKVEYNNSRLLEDINQEVKAVKEINASKPLIEFRVII